LCCQTYCHFLRDLGQIPSQGTGIGAIACLASRLSSKTKLLHTRLPNSNAYFCCCHNIPTTKMKVSIKKKEKSKKKLIKLLSGEPIDQPSDHDVRFGKGKGSYNAKGNKKMLALTAQYHPHVGNSYERKMRFCKHIVERIRSEGGRFVIRSNGKWYEVSDADAIAKVEQQFRNRKNKTPNTSSTKSANTASSSSSEPNVNIARIPTNPHTFLAIQRLQTAMLSVLQGIDSIPPGHPRPSRGEQEHRLLQDEGVRGAMLAMARSLPSGNTIVSPRSVARGPAAASMGPVAANPESHTSSSSSNGILNQADSSTGLPTVISVNSTSSTWGEPNIAMTRNPMIRFPSPQGDGFGFYAV